MADPKKRQGAQQFLRSRGYTEEEIQKWLSGPPKREPVKSPAFPAQRTEERAPHGTRAASQRAAPSEVDLQKEPGAHAPPPPREAGVEVREVEHWIAALQHEDVPAELRAVYLRNLKAAIEAAQTPGVTPEDVSYWLHRLRDKSVSVTLRAAYKRNVREALRRYNLK